MTHEAFVYRWYDAPNDMYYLGKHKGSPDDSYTHSSWIWPRFTKETIPEGVTREIIAEGTDEEMTKLEHILLKFEKEIGNWDRYYNESIGDPQVVDQWGKNNHMYGKTGENHPNWKGGISGRARMKADRERPEYKEWVEEYEKNRVRPPEYKAYQKKYYQMMSNDPVWVENRRKKNRRNATDETRLEYNRYMREYRAKKKAEKQGTGTLKEVFHE